METGEENDISVKRGWSYDGLWNLPIQNALIQPPDQLQVSVNKTEHGNVGVYKRDFFHIFQMVTVEESDFPENRDWNCDGQRNPHIRAAPILSGHQMQTVPDQPLDLCMDRSDQKSSGLTTASPKELTPTPSVVSSKKARKPYKRSYQACSLETAMDNIQGRAMPFSTASKKYGVPRSTLQYRMSWKYKNKGSRGPYTVLSTDEEEHIVKWLKDMDRKGYPITQKSLQYKVCNYLKTNPRPNPFKDNIPGKSWFKLFMNRHPDLSIRTPEAVTAASANVTEKDIRNWFRNVYSYLVDNNLDHILHDPSRILNGDETGLSLNPIPKHVIASKGKKDVSYIETVNSKDNVTVMFSFAADGTVFPPDVIPKLKRLSREILVSFPGDWGLGTSENGWMDSVNFVKYIRSVLYPTLKKRGTKFPVLYFVDGHRSHTSLEAAEACQKLGIIMIALYPNATRILQPADVSMFRPLKANWEQITEAWRVDHPSQQLTLTKFAPLLKDAMEKSFTLKTIVNGFTVCGLYPFDANAVNYDKCLGKSAEKQSNGLQENTDNTSFAENSTLPVLLTNGTNDKENEGMAEDSFKRTIAVQEDVLTKAIEMIGTSKISLYLTEDPLNLSHEDRALSYIYKNILAMSDPSRTLLSASSFDQSTDIIQNLNDVSSYDEESPLIDLQEESITFDHSGEDLQSSSLLEDNTFDHFEVIDIFEESDETVHVGDENLKDVESPVVFRDSTNTIKDTRKVEEFFTSPPTPKRNPKHRNYQNRTHFVLTAAERLDEMRISEDKKLEAIEMKKKRAELREVRKKEKEQMAEERKEKKKQRELSKQVAAEL
ncbi:uncharacterized protein LOC109424601 isoform X1 [Aedes albopictus]|uniref:HTH CENPB-type domain-containing protein n=1 Tax=Aedes albopictus TaxID=7160 RepID=A0ABM1XWW1_AEDAL